MNLENQNSINQMGMVCNTNTVCPIIVDTPVPQNYVPNYYLTDMHALPQNMQNRVLQSSCESQIRISEHMVKTDYSEQKKVQSYERRLVLKEQADERKRSNFDEVLLDDNGEIFVKMGNLAIVTHPRHITNMRKPKVTVFHNVDPLVPPCYGIACIVDGKERYVFLDSSRIGTGRYLLRKFEAAGIYFIYKPKSGIPEIVHRLVCMLISNSNCECELPNTEGWYTDSEGESKMAKKGDFTWTKLMTLVK